MRYSPVCSSRSTDTSSGTDKDLCLNQSSAGSGCYRHNRTRKLNSQYLTSNVVRGRSIVASSDEDEYILSVSNPAVAKIDRSLLRDSLLRLLGIQHLYSKNIRPRAMSNQSPCFLIPTINRVLYQDTSRSNLIYLLRRGHHHPNNANNAQTPHHLHYMPLVVLLGPRITGRPSHICVSSSKSMRISPWICPYFQNQSAAGMRNPRRNISRQSRWRSSVALNVGSRCKAYTRRWRKDIRGIRMTRRESGKYASTHSSCPCV